jgi:hypothetical protein
MKSNYRIDLEVKDKEHIDKVLTHMGISIDHIVISDLENIIMGYFVSLSKYELLYIRLACKFQEIHDLTKYEHTD